MPKAQNFYVRSVLFVVLSLVGAVITYMLYPLLARTLNLQAFGDYVAVVGLSNQLMGILLAFSVISVALVKQYGEDEAKAKTQVIQKVLIWLFIGLSVLVLLISPWLQNLLHIQQLVSFFILSLVMIAAVPANIWMGYLQGHKEQVRIGIFSVCTAVLKFIFILVLAALFGASGGLWGFLIGSSLGLVVLYYLPGAHVPKLDRIFKPLSRVDKSFLRSRGRYILQSIFVVAGLVFLQNYDLNRAKILFSPSQAGIYGGISVFSNALYFVSYLLIWIVLPEFDIHKPEDNKRVLKTSYKVILGMTVAVVIGGLLLGNPILKLTLGSEFGQMGTTLTVASLYQISLVSVVLYAFYLLVLNQRRSIFLTGCVLLSCFLIPLHFVSSPFAMIMSLWLSVLVGTAVFFVFFSKRKN